MRIIIIPIREHIIPIIPIRFHITNTNCTNLFSMITSCRIETNENNENNSGHE